jgi:hypothetical protein
VTALLGAATTTCESGEEEFESAMVGLGGGKRRSTKEVRLRKYFDLMT